MKKKYIDRQYIYERENKKCFFCSKFLYKNKITLDHYYPKKYGGTEEVFNLVCSCKKCNNMKKSKVPDNHKEHWIKYFVKAVVDGRISPPHGTYRSEFIKMIKNIEIDKVYKNGDYTVFEGDGKRIYVRENKADKIVEFYS
ncbi:MAG: HNH endonuclease [Firmicutes bacterium]|jgi:hypothetical protein|nr:HNH endonuclease [Bacillota bacterium]